MFNPFNKSIGTPLNEADLSELINQNVSEGYYIEYKGDIFPANNKIGQSIASFANTYGGWYFIGVETDVHNQANNICGFNLLVNPDPISQVREIIKSHIDPTPIFYIQVVPLAAPNRAVLVVYIPPEQNVPFVSKNGKIYRRTHDSSEPILENNRYAIDRLYDEGQKSIEKFEKFCRDERTFSTIKVGEIDLGWVNIFIEPIAYEPINKYEQNELELIRNVLERSQNPQEIYTPYEGIHINGNIPFNAGYPRFWSFILKQTNLVGLSQNGLTVEFLYDGRAKFHIPIRFFPYYTLQERKAITSQKILDIINELSKDEGMENFSLRFFDIGELWAGVTTLSSFYLDWLGNDVRVQILKIAIKFNEIWKAIPYFDDDVWAEHVENFGLPVSISDNLNFPDDTGKGFTFEPINKSTLGFLLFNKICIGFGLTLETQGDAIEHFIEKHSNNEN
ncbi:MAG TPA: ATP-binding protein [Pyrinomonadaceae bacterium]